MTERTLMGDLDRYLGEYHWSWGLVHKLVNRWYGTAYTISDLKRLYRAMK